MVYPLRNLLICFAIIVIVVLLIVLRTFSTLRSQEKEGERIVQSREVLQKLGPAIINMQEFEPVLVNYYSSSNKEFLDEALSMTGKLKQDADAMVTLGLVDKTNKPLFTQLGDITHKMIALASPNVSAQAWREAGVVPQSRRILLVDTFKQLASQLEAKHRIVLDDAYSQSLSFTRYTFSFVRIISVLILLILIISFYFIYHDFKTKKATEEQLKQFNTELEKQVTQKTAVISESEKKYRYLFESLQVSEKNMRYVLSSTSENFYVVDKDYRITLINETAERNLKTAWGAVVIAGTNIRDLIPDEKNEPIRASLDKVFNGEKTEYELFVPQDDLPPWVLVTYTPVTDETGAVIAAFIFTKDITEHKKAELELIEAESKFRNLVEQSLVGVYIIRAGKFAYVNPRFAEIFGYRQNELINSMNLENVIHPEHRAMVAENVRARITGEKESVHYEANGLKKNGEIAEIEVFCKGTIYEGGMAIIGTILDISERKRAEEAARANEDQLKMIYDTTTDAIFLVSVDDGKYRFNSINQAFLTTTGLKEYQVSGKLVDEVIPEPSLSQVLANYNKAVRTHQSVQWEETSDYPAGTRSGIVTVTPVYNEKGECNSLVGAVHDITERKKAEEATRKSEERYRILVENAPEALVVFDMANHKFVSVSESAVKLFKMPREELLLRGPVDMSPPYQPDGRLSYDVAMEKLKRAIGGEKPVFEWTHWDADNNPIPCEVWLVRLPAENQILIRGSIIDISERKKAEQEKEHVRYLLNERVKELTTLYQIGQILQIKDRSVTEIVQEIVSIVPSGWQYSNIAAARIVLDDMEFKTHNFGQAVHQQTATFPIPDGKQARIEIIYLEQRPAESEDAFLAEERNLINMIAEMLRIYLARIHEAEMNKQMQQEIVNQKIQDQKTVTRAILNAEERERNKIGRELHDNVNQILASIKLFMKMASDKNADGNNFLDRAVLLVDNAIEEIRSLSKSQVTPVKKIDLKDLIQVLVDRLEDSTSIKPIFHYQKEDKLMDDDLKLNIYRIVQEQINNVLKYADATQIDISVNSDTENLYVVVADNGRGFDPEIKRKGIGISNMINRVESFNGQLDIISSPGKGCKIDIRIPC